jgi:type I restriction enzyme M protein
LVVPFIAPSTNSGHEVLCRSVENPEGRWRRYSYEEIMRREGANLDLSWIRDKSLEDSAGLEDPDIIAEEIADDLQAALEQFATIASDLRERNG